MRAIEPTERIVPETVRLVPEAESGRTRVVATTLNGERALVGFLTRRGSRWYGLGPQHTRLPGQWRSWQEALGWLVDNHLR